jgi:hypothetical protein
MTKIFILWGIFVYLAVKFLKRRNVNLAENRCTLGVQQAEKNWSSLRVKNILSHGSFILDETDCKMPLRTDNAYCLSK